MNALLAAVVAFFTGTTPPAALTVQGYVEGDYLRLAAPVAGTLAAVAVREGERVATGAPLFHLDTAAAEAARAQAAAALVQAEAQLADLRKGQRPDELAALEAEKAQAAAALSLSRATLRRQETLARAAVAAQADLDAARAAVARDGAAVAELEARLRTALQGARPDAVAAQESLIAQRRAALAEADQHLADLQRSAPAAGVVDRLYYRPGEVVPAAQPVLALLPPENLKLVFFVPEPKVGALRVGQGVTYACDGCPGPGRAEIATIARSVEYTPPVIYSVTGRAKLVMRVEARPLSAVDSLHPGQPVDVTLDGIAP